MLTLLLNSCLGTARLCGFSSSNKVSNNSSIGSRPVEHAVQLAPSNILSPSGNNWKDSLCTLHFVQRAAVHATTFHIWHPSWLGSPCINAECAAATSHAKPLYHNAFQIPSTRQSLGSNLTTILDDTAWEFFPLMHTCRPTFILVMSLIWVGIAASLVH